MKLGFYTSYSEEIVEFAQKTGFRSLELAVWPNSSIDATTITDREIEKIKENLSAHRLEISALGVYLNYLDPNPSTREDSQAYFLQVLDLAKRMDVGLVCTFAGGNPLVSMSENIRDFKEIFTRFCEKAEKNDLRIALENCPMLDSVSMRPNNISFSPFVWDVIFKEVPYSGLGIELDPSHMVWMGIDYIQVVHDYKDRIFHVHAKDTEIRQDILARSGILGGFVGKIGAEEDKLWWRGRIPGFGSVEWVKFISALIEVGYSGNIDIEHEDSVLAQGPTFVFKEESGIVESFGHHVQGLRLGYHTLAGLIPLDEEI